jgi:hypothetical protein
MNKDGHAISTKYAMCNSANEETLYLAILGITASTGAITVSVGRQDRGAIGKRLAMSANGNAG